MCGALPHSLPGAAIPSPQIALLGAVAGFTIYLGLPIGRLHNSAPRLKTGLNAGATGILLFLLWDILGAAWEPIDAALGDHRWGTALTGGLVLAVGLTVGLAGLVHYDRWAARRQAPAAASPQGLPPRPN
ncbi:hypothetical protein [Streptomyces hirsutus]|uniref:hypothetical protein n=1 Tax=Streptomyces hirsutus TaxID=35620 RepID=UPI000A5F5771|nr:hypothetical protein [Streptomyces hirsutus]